MYTRTFVALAAATMLASTSSLALAQNNSGSDQNGGYENNQGYEDQDQNQGYAQDRDHGQDYEYDQGHRNDRYGRNQGSGQDEEYDQDYGHTQGYGENRGNDDHQGYRDQDSRRSYHQDRNYDRQQARGQIPRHLRRQLQEEGFTDIKIAPGSYVVSAHDSNGNPVLMLFGPHSVTMLRSFSGQDQNNSSNSNSNNSRNSDHYDRRRSSRQGENANAQCPDEMAFLQNTNNSHITAAERAKIRTKVFDSLDQNSDGVVSKDEYEHCLIETPAFKPAPGGAQAVK